MPDNAQAIGDDTEFENITEMAVDIKMLDLRIGGGMRRHGVIGCRIRIVVLVKAHRFRICFPLFNDPVCVFGIVFSCEGFNTGRIKDRHICFDEIDCLTDWLCKVNKVVKDHLQIIREVLFESGNLGGIRDFTKTTELPKGPGVVKKCQKELVGRDGEDTLNNFIQVNMSF